MLKKKTKPPPGGGGGGEGKQLASGGRVVLAGGKIYIHINSLAGLTRTTLGVAIVTECLD